MFITLSLKKEIAIALRKALVIYQESGINPYCAEIESVINVLPEEHKPISLEERVERMEKTIYALTNNS